MVQNIQNTVYVECNVGGESDQWKTRKNKQWNNTSKFCACACLSVCLSVFLSVSVCLSLSLFIIMFLLVRPQ